MLPRQCKSLVEALRQNEGREVTIRYAEDVERKRSADSDRQYRIQKSIKLATWAAVVAALFYASIAAFQANEMRKATKATQEAADAATKAVAESRRQFGISQESSDKALKATIDNFRLDQRAWVGLVNIETVGGKQSDDQRTGSYNYVRLWFRNSGKTPALNVSLQRLATASRWGYALGTAKPLPVPDFDKEVGSTERFYEEMTTELIKENPKNAEQIRRDRRANSPTRVLYAISPSGRAIAPSADFVFDWHATGQVSLRDARSTPITTYLLGKIEYSDVFSGTKRHTTKFCLMWYENRFIMCDGGGNWMN